MPDIISAKFIVCPYCKYEFKECISDMFKKRGDLKCMNCDKRFKLTVETITTYMTEKIK